MGGYWFERELVNGRIGRGVHPVRWQGYAVIAGFVAAMVGGGAGFFLIAFFTGCFALGIAVFAASALAGAGTFLWAATTKSDPKPRT